MIRDRENTQEMRRQCRDHGHILTQTSYQGLKRETAGGAQDSKRTCPMWTVAQERHPDPLSLEENWWEEFQEILRKGSTWIGPQRTWEVCSCSFAHLLKYLLMNCCLLGIIWGFEAIARNKLARPYPHRTLILVGEDRQWTQLNVHYASRW